MNNKEKAMSKKDLKRLEHEEYERNVVNYNRVVAIELANRSKSKVCKRDAFVSIQNVNKIYDNLVQAVYDFNLDIKKNEFIVFVGPSGCGKSTTLRMIAGLEEVTAGNIFIDGIYANGLPPKDRNIAMVFQSYALYPHMSVYDNMAFSMKIRPTEVPVLDENGEKIYIYNQEEDNKIKKQIVNKEKLINSLNKIDEVKLNKERIMLLEKLKTLTIEKKKKTIENKIWDIDAKIRSKIDLIINLKNDIKDLEQQLNFLKNHKILKTEYRYLKKEEINQQVQKAAKILQIEEYLNRKPKALSGGQRQRVALGRAICKTSKLFLMDEPLSNLDAKLRVSMRSEIIRLHKALGATTIYVTHDQTEAMTMADRIVIMKKGVIMQIGTPREIYDHPANVFVATFIGSPSMNMFDCIIDNNCVDFGNGNILHLPKETMDKIRTTIKNKIIEIKDFEANGLNSEYKKELNVKRETYKLDMKGKPIMYTHDEKGNILSPLDLISLNDYEKEICQNIFKSHLAKLKDKQAIYEDEIANDQYHVMLGIRPEDIYVKASFNPNEVLKSDELDLIVSITELLGNEYYVHTNFETHDLTLKAKSSLVIKENDHLKAYLDMNKLHIFDNIDSSIMV
jgi:ABC-type sugar transport system ATPase subunit